MAGVTRVGVNGAGGGMLGREARTQYAAMARMRWRMFMNGLRSIHGLLDLGATGIAWLFYSVMGLGLGAGLFSAAYSLASRASWQYLPILFWAISFLWLMFPLAVASFQEHSDLGILLRFPVRFGSYFLLDLISGLMEASTIDRCPLLSGGMAWNRHGAAGFVSMGDARTIGIRGLQHSVGARCLCLD